MGALSYLDFDLQIDDLGAGSYRVYVLASPAGQAEAFFNLPFSDLEIENFFLRIGRPRRGIRRINSAEMNEARKFGSKLHEAVFQDSVQACLLRSIDFAQHREQGLRLRLRLPPSLIELPWEYLYDPAQNRFLVHSTSTPVVRYLDLPQVVKPLAAALPLKVLVMIASPHDYQPLDVEAEWQKIKAAVATLEERGLVQLTRLPLQQQGATLAALQKRLRSDTFQIFHFIGHGGFDEQTQDGVLLFEMEDGRSRLVSGNYLGTLLHDQPSLRLAILNACEGARTTQSDPFAGVAQQLVRQGIPAVIAMQNEITDGAAIQLAHEFYDALSAGYPVDGALAEARKALFAAGNDIEWGTPVLYLRASDGKLFDLVGQPTGQAAPRPAPGALAQPIPARQDASLPAETATAHGRRPWLARWGLFLLVGALVLAGGLALWRWNPDGATNAPAATPMATSAPQATAGSGAQPTAPAASQAQPATPILSASEVASRTILLVEASDALGNSDTTTGKRIYEQLLAANPADVEALVGLARALRQEGNNAEALRALAQANAIAPDSPTANFALGVLYFEEFDSNQQAIEHLTRALEDASPDLKRDAYAYRALVHAKKGDYASAIADMDAIIADDASSDDYVQRAQFHQAQGDDVAAARDFTAAIDRAPGVGKYYLYRADFYANLNQVDKALADYGTFLKIRDPGGSQSEIDRAENYIRLHNPAQMSVPAPGPANDKAGLAFTNTVDGAQYVFVPAGPFDMGLDEGRFDEKPRHEVELDAFWIMQTEVTNEQYEKCVIADVCSPPFHPDWGSDEFWATYDRHPVTHVTWEQATTYAQWAGGRLPTEAEWEKAARGIDGRRYPWGNTVPKVQRLNFNNDVGDTQPVGSYPDGAGPYGTLDMAGNVWEWVADWYAEDYYATSPRANPTGPAEGERRIRRGGSFRDALYNVGATYRDWAAMTDQNDAVGFRVVQEKAPE